MYVVQIQLTGQMIGKVDGMYYGTTGRNHRSEESNKERGYKVQL